MTDNFKEIGSLFGREGSGAGFVKQTDKESFTYAFAWPEGDTWATLTGYLNLDEQPGTCAAYCKMADSAPIGATRITTPSVISRRQPVTNIGFLS